ncbi:MAG: hypothetical protein E7236_07140 [Lachnospiraceae bacterium]|nr:hypothetical protein [Lachnospiraceae bacterium]
MDKIEKKIKSLLILSLCILMMVCMMTGCRQSPALVDNIYTKDATEVDPEQLVSSADQSDETDDLETVQDQENKQDNQEQAKTAAVQNDQFSDQNQTKNVQGSKNNNSSQASSGETSDNDQAQTGAADGSKTDGSGGVNEGVGTGGEGQNTDGTGTGETIPDTIPDEPIENSESETDNPETDQSGASDQAGEGDNSQESGGNGNETPSKWNLPRKAVRDASDTEWNIPRDVYTVTAVGAAAPLVEMVGGSGRLMASSASFTQGALANSICQDVINGNVLTWWDGDGSEPLSENNFQALMAASPDVCFVVGGQTTFTTEQLTALQEAGIGYVPLPELNSLENIKSAVNIVAATLETNETTHEQAKSIAREYSDWVDHIISEVNTDTVSGTMVISGWDASAKIRSYAETGMTDIETISFLPDVSILDYPRADGYLTVDRQTTGIAVGWASEMFNHTPCAQLLGCSGVMVVGNRQDTGYVPFVSGSEGKYQYYIPTYVPFSPMSGEEGFGLFLYAGGEVNQLVTTSWWYDGYTPMLYIGQGRSDPYIRLGDPEFKTVIAESQEAKTAIESSSLWRYYTNEEYGAKSNRPRQTLSLDRYTISIKGPYNIYINPIGFNSWLYGGVDSPLEAVWAACKISGTVSESKLKSEVEGFYEEFFGVTPNYNSIITQ